MGWKKLTMWVRHRQASRKSEAEMIVAFVAVFGSTDVVGSISALWLVVIVGMTYSCEMISLMKAYLTRYYMRWCLFVSC